MCFSISVQIELALNYSKNFRLTSFGISPKYLFWSSVRNYQACEKFYVTSAFDNETDMFDIFYQASDNDEYYSPTCCFLSNDNVNTPIVDQGLTMCKCNKDGFFSDINIIDIDGKKPVIKKLLH